MNFNELTDLYKAFGIALPEPDNASIAINSSISFSRGGGGGRGGGGRGGGGRGGGGANVTNGSANCSSGACGSNNCSVYV